MSLKWLVISAWMVSLAVATPSLAQYESPSSHPFEITGLVGRTFIANQAIKGAAFFNSDVRFGNGLTFEIDPSRRWYATDSGITTISVEMPFAVNWDEDLGTGANLIPSHFRSFFATPAMRVNLLAGSALSPWISFGGGLGHFSESSTLLYGGPNPGPTGTTTGVVQGGVGFELRLSNRFSVRTEARDFWSGVPQLNVDTGKTRQHNIFVGSGLVIRFR